MSLIKDEVECVIDEGQWEIPPEEIPFYVTYGEEEGIDNAGTSDEQYILPDGEVYYETEAYDDEVADTDVVAEDPDESDDETVGIFSDDLPCHSASKFVSGNSEPTTAKQIGSKRPLVTYSRQKPKAIQKGNSDLKDVIKRIPAKPHGITTKELFKDFVKLEPGEIGGLQGVMTIQDTASRFPYRCSICCKGFASEEIFETHQAMHLKLLAVEKLKPVRKSSAKPTVKRIVKRTAIIKYVHPVDPEANEHEPLIDDDVQLDDNCIVYDDSQDDSLITVSFKCHGCGLDFNDEVMLQEHVMQAHGQDVKKRETSGKKFYFTCLVCDEVFTSAADRKEHESLHEPDQCSLCGEYLSRRELQKHISSHSKPKKEKTLLPLTQCELCTRQVRDLEKHMEMHASDGSRYYKCFHCELKFDRVKVRNNHEESHGVSEQCPDCEVILTHSLMRQHIAQKHNTKPKIQCEVCGKEVIDMKSHRSKHRRQAAGLAPLKKKARVIERNLDRTFVCPYCMNRLASNRALQQHVMRIHNVGDTIFCRSCTSIFKTSEELVEHRLTCQIRKSESTRQCPICGRILPLVRFGAHVRFHAWHEIGPTFTRGNANEMQPAQCPRCPSVLRSGFHLANHIVSHYNLGWDYECATCHKCFSSEIRLIHHKENGLCNIKMKIYPKKRKPKEEGESLDGTPAKKSQRKSGASSNWACSECMEVFKNKLACQTHIAECH